MPWQHMHSLLFQSTLPREERLPAIGINYHVEDFNPRSHERSDVNVHLEDLVQIISIHAPTRGATSRGT